MSFPMVDTAFSVARLLSSSLLSSAVTMPWRTLRRGATLGANGAGYLSATIPIP